MTVIYENLQLFATKDGLLARSASNDGGDTKSTALLISWSSQQIVNQFKKVDNVPEIGARSIACHGIIGLLNLSTSKHLITIKEREKVAVIDNEPIFTITDILLIPLNSQKQAEEAIVVAIQSTKHQAKSSGYETDESDHVEHDEDHEDAIAPLEAKYDADKTKSTPPLKQATKAAAQYGRFAQRWFSKGFNRPTIDATKEEQSQNPAQDENAATKKQTEKALDAPPSHETANEDIADISADTTGHADIDEHPAESETSTTRSSIDKYTRRILRTARLYFSSRNFFFSYAVNISKRLSAQHEDLSLPLHKRFEPDFFWNAHLLKPMIEFGGDEYILPLIQGFVGQRSFSVNTAEDVTSLETKDGQDVELRAYSEQHRNHDFKLTIISRRSIKRAGLRYLRRGIDELGNVANSVETEQILSQTTGQHTKSFSLAQVRGSIPLFFSQSPYSLKPVTQRSGSEATNRAAFQKHLNKLTTRYGDLQIASLVDKHGTEVDIGKAYEDTAAWYNTTDSKSVDFEWFDFHRECKGMHFENVSLLINTLEPKLQAFGWTSKLDQQIGDTQSGILRTNCMDCLDRTNVTQSAVGGWILKQQLSTLGFEINLQTDAKSIWFNQLWADNGDAISRQYAGTAALKGDFTRTRKRNWTGALSDFSLTLNRYYNNIFGDYFLQTCIDFLLGNADASIFDTFESDLTAQDHAIDVNHLRENAIDACVKIVLADPEEKLLGGWTVSCPQKPNTLRSMPFEECVLLLTASFFYSVRFDWKTEKVGSYEKIDLLDIKSIWRGVYITSSLGASHLDEKTNVGFALQYETHGKAVVRTNTRSMDNTKPADSERAARNGLQKQANQKDDTIRLLAFKMLQAGSSVAKTDENAHTSTEEELVKRITNSINEAMIVAIRKDRGVDHPGLDTLPKVEDRPVISAADAKHTTSYIESIGYSLKKMVW